MRKNRFADHFSSDAEGYNKFRPEYPEELFSYLSGLCPSVEIAWDCATGSGQAAVKLAGHFRRVIATDASKRQIGNARCHPRILYEVALADAAPIKTASVDLITVAQALHWFPLDAFFSEARRVLKSEGIIAVWSYNLLSVSTDVDDVIRRFYHEIVGDCWPPERAAVERGYKDIVLPFDEIQAPAFAMTASWSLERLIGYLGTWSAVRRYKEMRHADPVGLIYDELREKWGDIGSVRPVLWPLTVRIGKKNVCQ
jgi:SAM-dependent methyltransferase